MRGITAQELHGTLRHYYVMVDELVMADSKVSPRALLYQRTNQLKYPGIIHVMNMKHEEIDRFQV